MILYEVVDLLTGFFESIVSFIFFDNYMDKREYIPKYTQ